MTTPTRNAFEEARDWNRLVPGSAAEMRAEYSAQLKHKQRIETAQMVFQYFGPFLGAGVIVTALSMGVWLITTVTPRTGDSSPPSTLWAFSWSCSPTL